MKHDDLEMACARRYCAASTPGRGAIAKALGGSKYESSYRRCPGGPAGDGGSMPKWVERRPAGGACLHYAAMLAGRSAMPARGAAAPRGASRARRAIALVRLLGPRQTVEEQLGAGRTARVVP